MRIAICMNVRAMKQKASERTRRCGKRIRQSGRAREQLVWVTTLRRGRVERTPLLPHWNKLRSDQQAQPHSVLTQSYAPWRKQCLLTLWGAAWFEAQAYVSHANFTMTMTSQRLKYTKLFVFEGLGAGQKSVTRASHTSFTLTSDPAVQLWQSHVHYVTSNMLWLMWKQS